ncbi:glycosyltransferase [Dactylosporangium darangshiense]|uniref:Glycosyl transferase n=1 Tax=Dactylosporangium darangshiense TaxID=579108 RepID=A0ABP8DDA5_9ACTN
MTWRYPPPSYDHLLRLSDDIGLFEHADHAVPRLEHGYCVDDVARGLVVICREPEPSGALLQQAERYLAFIERAQRGDGMFHNRLGYDRTWLDEPASGDWWGRAAWAAGTAAVRSPMGDVRRRALACFERAARCRSRWPRSMAYAALGAAEVLSERPDHAGARWLLNDAATTVGRAGDDPQWPWPEPQLTYANALIPATMIAAGRYLGRPAALADGLLLLRWLLEQETHGGHLSCTPVGGRRPGERPPAFDQQPIEAATLAEACVSALDLAGGERWEAGLASAVDWFMGNNDTGVALYDPGTGGGYDGLTADGRNANQGAESTLAALATLQYARRLA